MILNDSANNNVFKKKETFVKLALYRRKKKHEYDRRMRMWCIRGNQCLCVSRGGFSRSYRHCHYRARLYPIKQKRIMHIYIHTYTTTIAKSATRRRLKRVSHLCVISVRVMLCSCLCSIRRFTSLIRMIIQCHVITYRVQFCRVNCIFVIGIVKISLFPSFLFFFNSVFVFLSPSAGYI